MAESSVFSPDGQRIAYTWWNEDNEGYEVRIVGMDGSKEWAVLQHPAHVHLGPDATDRELGYVMVEDWSSDGEQLLALLWYGNRAADTREEEWFELGTISTKDGSIRTLKRTEWRTPEMAVFSPSDRYIAFDFPPDRDPRDHDLFVMDVESGRESTLLAGPGDDRLMGWVPDGSGILFHSDRNLTQGIWFLPVSNGRASGQPRLLKADVWGLSPLGFSETDYYYGVTTERRQVHTAVIDFEAGRFAVPPAPVEHPAEGRSQGPVWSPDGRYLAYVQEIARERARQIVIRSVAGDDKREIPLTIERAGIQQWTADGQTLLLAGREKGQRGYYRVDLTSGQEELLISQRDLKGDVRGGDFSPDGGTLYFTRRSAEDLSQLVGLDLETRAEMVLASWSEGDGNSRLRVSPDGRTVAYYLVSWSENPGARIMVVPAIGGESVELAWLPGVVGMGGLAWSSDGSYLVYRRQGMEEDLPDTLWRIAVSGGEPEKVLTSETRIGGVLQVHPDGRRVAFQSGQLRGEIWVLENLPGTQPRIQASRGEG